MADLGGGCRGCAPPPGMTCGFLIQLVFCQKKTMWFIGVEVEQETSAPPPKKNPGSAPDLMYMLWFNFILSSNFIFLCFKLKVIHYQTREQREITFKPRKKLNHNTYTWFKRGRFGYWSIATQANHCNEFPRNAQMSDAYRQWPISKATFMELGIQGWY